MGLVDAGTVLSRLNMKDAKLPDTAKSPARLQEMIDGATAELLLQSGRSKPPAANTPARGTLDNLCVDLVVNSVRRELHGDDHEMLRELRAEKADILARAAATREAEPGTGVSIDVVGAG